MKHGHRLVASALLGAGLATVGIAGAAETDARDLEHIRPLLSQTLETEKSGVEIRWSNPATGHAGTLRVERTFYRDKQPCRDYVRTVEQEGRTALVVQGTGCRSGRAQWEIERERTTAQAPASPGTAPTRGLTAPRPAPETSARAAAAPSRECPDPQPAAAARAAQEKPKPFATYTLPARSAL